MKTDSYYLANEKLINESWLQHNLAMEALEKENKKQLEIHYWGGGRYDAPPF